jgi:hypothetical protein
MIAIQDPGGRTRYDSAPTEEAAWAKLERIEDEKARRRAPRTAQRRTAPHVTPSTPPPVLIAESSVAPAARRAPRLLWLVSAVRVTGRWIRLQPTRRIRRF